MRKLQKKWHNEDIREILIRVFGDKCMRCRRYSRYPIATWIGRLQLCVDHVIPKSKGGTDHIQNRQLLCHGCNAGKKDKRIDYRPKNFLKLVLDNN